MSELRVSERYELAEPLGEGGMATVYEATDIELQRTVAVKCLKPELAARSDYRERFFDEARIMSVLDQPGTVPVHEAGRLPDGRCFYSMQRVRGRTLKDLLHERSYDDIRSRHSLMRFVDIFSRVCRTMAGVHAEDVIHRDLKPENVMVDEFGGVHVMDWGLAKRVRQGESTGGDTGRTREGAIMGTPGYMSPELARGEAHESDTQSDVFSLGIMLYETLTGINPFFKRTEREAMKGVLYHDPDPPKKVNPRASRALSAVCMKALNKDPYRRYPSARELAEDIRRYREFLPVSAIRPRLADRLYNWGRRWPKLATALVTLLGATLIAGGALAFQISVETHVVDDMYEALETTAARLDEIDQEMGEVAVRLQQTPEGTAEWRALRMQLDTLESRRDVEDDVVRGITWAIMGFTIFSPDARAQQIARDDLLGSVQGALNRTDPVDARVLILYALESYAGENIYGLTEEQAEWLRERLAGVEQVLRDVRNLG